MEQKLEVFRQTHGLRTAITGVGPGRLGKPGWSLKVELVREHVCACEQTDLHVVALVRAQLWRDRSTLHTNPRAGVPNARVESFVEGSPPYAGGERLLQIVNPMTAHR